MATWFELSRDLQAGDRVRFDRDWDRYPDVYVRAGNTGTVVENNLNEMEPALLVRPDDANMREQLKEWDGVVFVYGPWHRDESWDDVAPVSKILAEGSAATDVTCNWDDPADRLRLIERIGPDA